MVKGTKQIRKKIQSSLEDIFSVFFICFVYFVCSFNIFHFYIIIFSLLYFVRIFGESFKRVGKLRGVT